MSIQRNEILKGLSRDHHAALLLCWKIRAGIKHKVELSRINEYRKWFAKSYLLPHFRIEEKRLFPLLGLENEHVKKAIKDHLNIKSILAMDVDLKTSLMMFELALDEHIRFEERVLFNVIQEQVDTEKLLTFSKYHKGDKFIDNISDPFWENL